MLNLFTDNNRVMIYNIFNTTNQELKISCLTTHRDNN